MFKRRLLHIFSPLLLLAAVGAMVSCNNEIEPNSSMGGSRNVSLSLSIAVTGSASSRAGEHLPADDNEKLSSLRTIVVRPDGTVEINTLQRFTTATEQCELQYRVRNNETKTVYLIANELGNMIDYYDAAHVGSRIDSALLERCMDLVPAVDQPIPMSAVYLLPVSNALADENETVHYTNLKLLRSVAKFTLNFINSHLSGDEADSGFLVTDLSLGGFADKAYLFPHVKTTARETIIHSLCYNASGQLIESATGHAPVVSGGDNAQDDLSYTDHYRDAYVIPADASHTAYTPTLISGAIVVGRHASQSLVFYRNESECLIAGHQAYTISFSVHDSLGYFLGSYSAALPNLESLPRNTHAVINVYLRSTMSNIEVDVEPYAHVELEPEFGL